MRRNLFNPGQSVSPQSWHVPKANVFDVTQTPNLNLVPRVVFSPGPLESDLRNRMAAFENQPEQLTLTHEIVPGDFGFVLTYTLPNKPLKPLIEVQANYSGGSRQTLAETDDFLVNYDNSEITFREDVSGVDRFDITYRTGQVAGPSTSVCLTQLFSIEVVAENGMKAESVTAIIIGVIEAFKEDMLSEPDKTYDGLNLITYLKPVDIQLVNKAEEGVIADRTSVTLNYRVPGMMRIVGKVPEEGPSVIEKIFHPDVVDSEQDVVLEAKVEPPLH